MVTTPRSGSGLGLMHTLPKLSGPSRHTSISQQTKRHQAIENLIQLKLQINFPVNLSIILQFSFNFKFQEKKNMNLD